MKIQKNALVAINYVLKDDDGELIDSTKDTTPLEYIHGNNYLLPKLEELLEGKESGDKFTADLKAADAYGEYDKSLLVDIPRDSFETDMEIEPGMQFQAMTPAGPQIVKVTKIQDSTVTVDANHELAGVNLHFEIEVVSVREATEEEIAGMNSGCSCGGCSGGCGEGCGDSCGEGCTCGGGCGC